MDPNAAGEEAERRFGDLRRERRRIIVTDGRGVMTRWRGDRWTEARSAFRQTARSLRRSPGFTAAVVVTLGLGIGVNAAMFGVVDRLLLRPPAHVVEPDLVRRVLWEGRFFGQQSTNQTAMAYPDIVDLRGVPEIASVGAVTSVSRLTLGRGQDARQVRVVRMTQDFTTTLGVQPALGRFFDADDDRVDAPLTAVLSHEFWVSSFGEDPGVLGRTITIAGFDATIIGVAPQGFTGIELQSVDVWLPALPFDALRRSGNDFVNAYGSYWLGAVVRVRSTDEIEIVEERATAVRRANRPNAADARVFTAPLIRARGPLATDASRVARWATGVSSLVFLIACANVANLLLVRSAARRRESAVRLSLGVSRGRLVRERMLETFGLAGIASLLAIILGEWGGRLIQPILLPDSSTTAFTMTPRVIALVAMMSIVATVLSGLGPAIQSTRVNLAPDLRGGGRGASARRSSTRVALAVAQAAISTVLLVGAGLFVKSVAEARGTDLGLDMDRLVVAQLELEGGEGLDAQVARRTYEEAMQVAARHPGVTAVAVTDVPYQSASIPSLRVQGLDSVPVPPGGGPFYNGVSPGYLAATGIALLQGRPLLETDRAGSVRVALVSETMARSVWPGGSALGACLFIQSEECTSVVGVVTDASWEGLEDAPHFSYYVPLEQSAGAQPRALYLRTEGDPRQLTADIAPTLRAFSPRVRFADVQPFRDLLAAEMRAWFTGASLFTAFGVLALLVASVGLYSILSFEVAQRTREFGIRAALGAPSRSLKNLELKGFSRLAS
jgi:predicted permease